ncbi:hypothetical protein X751_29535 [Mesorhizobium sp. LNJC395A00]|nr:hypothetical protein X751_29535 [Mesorhizobium sp. LNJC395A00]
MDRWRILVIVMSRSVWVAGVPRVAPLIRRSDEKMQQLFDNMIFDASVFYAWNDRAKAGAAQEFY